MKKKKVVVAKNFRIVLNMICRRLEEAGFSVVGRATNWREAVKIVEERQPDIVILGNHLPHPGFGELAARKIRKMPNPPKIVSLSVVRGTSFGDVNADFGEPFEVLVESLNNL